MEKLTKSQAFGAGGGIKATKILQINYRHPVMIDMKNRIEEGEGEDNQQLEDLLLDVALIKSGFDIDNDDQQSMAQRVDRIARQGLGVAIDAPLEEEPEYANEVDADEDEEDEDDEDEDEDDEEDEDEGELQDDEEEEEGKEEL